VTFASSCTALHQLQGYAEQDSKKYNELKETPMTYYTILLQQSYGKTTQNHKKPQDS
jgi:hypothetical protein